jgi:hypothetical protein
MIGANAVGGEEGRATRDGGPRHREAGSGRAVACSSFHGKTGVMVKATAVLLQKTPSEELAPQSTGSRYPALPASRFPLPASASRLWLPSSLFPLSALPL